MKKLNKLFMFIFAVVMAFTSVIKVYAIDQTITFKSSRAFTADRKFQNAGTTVKIATISGKDVFAYCFNHALEAPPAGTKLTFNEALTKEAQKYEAAYTYILDNGLGGNWNSKYGAGLTDDDDKFYVTQLAIWGVLYKYDTKNGVDIGSLSKDQNGKNISSRLQAIKENAIKLRNDALNNTYTKAEIHLSDSSNGVMTKTGDTYRTGTMKVTGYGYQKYKIEVTGVNGATIVDGKGTTHGTSTELNAGADFYVRIPASAVTVNGVSVTTKVSAIGTKRNLAIYQPPAGSKNQNVGIAYTTTTPVNDSKTSKASIKTGALNVYKVYKNLAGAESNLAGAKLQLLGPDGKKVDEWVSDGTDKPHYIGNLTPGTYTLHEESAPEGYLKAADQKVVIEEGKTATGKLINTKQQEDVYISKQDATNGNELPGAKLELRNATGEIVDEWTSTDEQHKVVNKERADGKLLPGKYCLKETIAPEGYQFSTEEVCFMVNNEGKVDEPVVMKNAPKTSVKISKQDVTTKKELPGAKLTIKDSTGKVVDEWISSTKPHYVTLPDGNYKLIELAAPEGYGISEEVIDFTIKNGESEKTIVMTNEPIPVTADMNLTMIIVGLVATVLLVGFSLFKLNKQQEA